MPVTTLVPETTARLRRGLPKLGKVPVLSTFVRWLRLDFGGVIGAAFFFCLSLTPSLLPRPWLYQAVVSGLTAAIGYALGAMAGSVIRFLTHRIRRGWTPARRTVLVAWWLCAVVGGGTAAWYLTAAARWQTQLRALMSVESPGPNHYLLILLLAGALFLGLIGVGRAVRGASRWLRRLLARWVPLPVALVVSVLCVAYVALWSWNGVLYPTLLGVANNAFAAVNQETEAGNNAPASATHSGGPGSLVSWESLGRKGREFVSSGPTVDDLEAFRGEPALDPVRAYIGMDSAETPAGLASLAVRELERADGFDREVLVVVTTTGTGWVDAAAADALEYLYNGDSAIVTVQYSYLPSWISFVADQEQVQIAGRALFDAVYDEWSQLPEATRPRLLVYGESLGGLGSGAAFDDLDDLTSKVDGALWVGTPTRQALRTHFTAEREPGSPARLPVYDDGRTVRFWGGWQEPLDLDDGWKTPRVLYLQHASDPVAFWAPELIWSQPDWLMEEHGPDVLPNFDWYPFVTFWQIAADMAVSAKVPAGHAHNYGGELVDAWLAIAPPDDWPAERTQDLRDMVHSFVPTP
ncbi:MAG TPA: alpha/beta-hydrolase family protein [Jiangellaceae bacterium]